MGKYILKRLLYMIPMMLLVIVVIFLIMSLTPGDPASANLPMTTPPDVKEAYNEAVGFSGSLWSRFAFYIKGLFSGNIPSYTTKENIFVEIGIRLPYTFKLGGVAFVLATIIGVSFGIFSAVKQYSFFDTTITILAVFFGSVPGFLFATLSILYFSVGLGWFPSYGAEHGIRSFVLPIAATTLSIVPQLSRMTRSAMLMVMNQDYIRTARAKGCNERLVIWKHVLKNASLPIITLLVSGFASVIGGAVIIEQIFSLPGIGLYMLNAINGKNVPVVMTCALLLAFVYMVSMVLMDIFYALIDPRVRTRYQ